MASWLRCATVRSVADPAGADSSNGSPPAHVVLVGMMGVGKTTVGKRVAKLLGRTFVDADAELVRRSGRTVAEWFAGEGEAGFRDAECDVLADLLEADDPHVVAAGGGAVVDARNRDRLRGSDVFVVWLRAEPAFLAHRVARKAHRPLIADDPVSTLTRLATVREPWYAEVADAVIDVGPVHSREERPKRVLAEQVADAVVAHGAAGRVGR